MLPKQDCLGRRDTSDEVDPGRPITADAAWREPLAGLNVDAFRFMHPPDTFLGLGDYDTVLEMFKGLTWTDQCSEWTHRLASASLLGTDFEPRVEAPPPPI